MELNLVRLRGYAIACLLHGLYDLALPSSVLYNKFRRFVSLPPYLLLV